LATSAVVNMPTSIKKALTNSTRVGYQGRRSYLPRNTSVWDTQGGQIPARRKAATSNESVSRSKALMSELRNASDQSLRLTLRTFTRGTEAQSQPATGGGVVESSTLVFNEVCIQPLSLSPLASIYSIRQMFCSS
jgi:hypothetical protein